MVKIVADTALLAQLHNLDTPLEFCDPAGRTLGYFQPASAHWEPRITEEELDRREKAGGGRPLAAILADLERRA